MNLNDAEFATRSAVFRHVHPPLGGQVPPREPNSTFSTELKQMSINGNLLPNSEIPEVTLQYLSQKEVTPDMHVFHFIFTQ